MAPLSALVLGLVLASSPTAKTSDKEAVAEATKTAKENVQSEDGKKYKSEVDKHYETNYKYEIMGHCIKSSVGHDMRNFRVLIRLDSAGVPEEVLVSPSTNIAKCLMKDIKNGKSFPKPPSPDYWVKIEVVVKEAIRQ